MDKKLRKTKRFLNKYPDLTLRLTVSLVAFFLLLGSTVFIHLNASQAATPEVIFLAQEQTQTNLDIPQVTEESVTTANTRRKVEEDKKIELERLAKERDDKINRVITFLQNQASPVANYDIAAIIVDESEANGADFRVVVAIMGIESGFCNASFWYNCFGYLNGVRYSSYTDAFSDLVPKVARQYAAPYGWNFEALARAYGMINWEYHSKNLYYYANSI